VELGRRGVVKYTLELQVEMQILVFCEVDCAGSCRYTDMISVSMRLPVSEEVFIYKQGGTAGVKSRPYGGGIIFFTIKQTE